MKKSEENKTENATIVNDVVLTADAIGFLKSLQECNNSHLQTCIETISNGVCYIGSNIYQLQTAEQFKEAALVMSDLCILREELKNLMKP